LKSLKDLEILTNVTAAVLAAADNSGAEKAEHGHKLTVTSKLNAMRRQLKRRMLS